MSEMADYQTRANEWFERAKEEKDLFVKFILLYISFEVLCKLNNFDKYKLNEDIKNKFFESIANDELDNLKEELDKKPLKNEQRGSGLIKLQNKRDFLNILKFVNQGRNNLFHGDKGLDNERDILIITKGSKILDSLIEVMINE